MPCTCTRRSRRRRYGRSACRYRHRRRSPHQPARPLYIGLRAALLERRNELDSQLRAVEDVIRTLSKLRPDLAAKIPISQRVRRTKADLSRPLRELLERDSGRWMTVAVIDIEYRKTLSKDASQPTAGAVRNALAYMARTARTIERRISEHDVIEYRSRATGAITGDNVGKTVERGSGLRR